MFQAKIWDSLKEFCLYRVSSKSKTVYVKYKSIFTLCDNQEIK